MSEEQKQLDATREIIDWWLSTEHVAEWSTTVDLPDAVLDALSTLIQDNLKKVHARGYAQATKDAEAKIVWEDADDIWSEQIAAAHPSQTGNHDAYQIAMMMVGNRHSKAELVALVCWLISRGDHVPKDGSK